MGTGLCFAHWQGIGKYGTHPYIIIVGFVDLQKLLQ